MDKFPLGQFIRSEENIDPLSKPEGAKAFSAESTDNEIGVNLRHQVIVIGRNSDSYNQRLLVMKPEQQRQ